MRKDNSRHGEGFRNVCRLIANLECIKMRREKMRCDESSVTNLVSDMRYRSERLKGLVPRPQALAMLASVESQFAWRMQQSLSGLCQN